MGPAPLHPWLKLQHSTALRLFFRVWLYPVKYTYTVLLFTDRNDNNMGNVSDHTISESRGYVCVRITIQPLPEKLFR